MEKYYTLCTLVLLFPFFAWSYTIPGLIVSKDVTMAQKKPTPKSKLLLPNDFIELSFEWSQVEPVYNQVVKQASRDLSIAGFRPGKVPPKVAEQKLDPSKIVARVVEKISPQPFEEKLAQQKPKLIPISAPMAIPVAVEKGKTWQVRVEFATEPQIKIKDYQKIVQKAKKTIEAELKKNKKQTTPAANTSNDDLILQAIFQALITTFKPAVPQLLVRQRTEDKIRELSQVLERVKMSVDDYLAKRKLTTDQLVSQLSHEALASVQVEFILRAITQEAKIKATPEEIKKQIDDIQNKEVRAHYQGSAHHQEQLAQSLARQKTFQHLLAL